MIKDINISIAAGEVLLFLENTFEVVSIERLELFLRTTRLNVYFMLNLLITENLIYVKQNTEGVSFVGLKSTKNAMKASLAFSN